MSEKIENVKKIAILRPNAIGDFIVCLPALQALKDTFPDAEIVYIGKEVHKSLVQDRQIPIDRVEIIPGVRGVGKDESFEEDKEEVNNFIKRMVDENFDIGVQMTGGGKNSNPFLLKMKPRIAIGSKTPDAAQLDRTIPYFVMQNEVIRFLEIVALVGAYPKNISPKLNTTDKDFEELNKQNLNLEEKYVVIHAGSTDPRRQWSENNFAEISKFLKNKGFNVYLIGDEADNSMNEKIYDLSHGSAINLSGKLSLNGLIGLLSKAHLVVANDSGPSHISYALGKNTISIIWIKNYLNYGEIYRKNYYPLISWVTNCPECGLDFMTDEISCRHKNAYVKNISVDDVLNAIGTFLK